VATHFPINRAKLIILFNPLQAEFEVRESRDAEHLLELTRQAGEDRPDVIVAAGGDGKAHYALHALVGYETPWDCFRLAPETIWPGVRYRAVAALA
jgi:diacylglycerol kinase family enzyme